MGLYPNYKILPPPRMLECGVGIVNEDCSVDGGVLHTSPAVSCVKAEREEMECCEGNVDAEGENL